MSDPDLKPEYAPNERVLVAGKVFSGPDENGGYSITFMSGDENTNWAEVRASDVNPIDSDEDPRDKAIAAIRELCNKASYDAGIDEAMDNVIKTLNSFVPAAALTGSKS